MNTSATGHCWHICFCVYQHLNRPSFRIMKWIQNRKNWTNTKIHARELNLITACQGSPNCLQTKLEIDSRWTLTSIHQNIALRPTVWESKKNTYRHHELNPCQRKLDCKMRTAGTLTSWNAGPLSPFFFACGECMKSSRTQVWKRLIR
jgi:hypothetical protein